MAEALQETGIEQGAAQVSVTPGIEAAPEHLGWGDLRGQLAEGLELGARETQEFLAENGVKIAIGLVVIAGVSAATVGIVELLDAQAVRAIDFSPLARVGSALWALDWKSALRNYLEWGDYLYDVIEYSKPLALGGYAQTTLDTGGPLETIADLLGIAREGVAAGCEKFDVTTWNPQGVAQHIKVEAVDSLGRVVDAVGLSTDKLSSHTEVVFCADDISKAVTTKMTEPVRSTALRLP